MYHVNDKLLTKDGRNIGNAIMIRADYSNYLEEYVYTIKTDYGNETSLTKRELEEWFHKDVRRADENHKHYQVES